MKKSFLFFKINIYIDVVLAIIDTFIIQDYVHKYYHGSIYTKTIKSIILLPSVLYAILGLVVYKICGRKGLEYLTITMAVLWFIYLVFLLLICIYDIDILRLIVVEVFFTFKKTGSRPERQRGAGVSSTANKDRESVLSFPCRPQKDSRPASPVYMTLTLQVNFSRYLKAITYWHHIPTITEYYLLHLKMAMPKQLIHIRGWYDDNKAYCKEKYGNTVGILDLYPQNKTTSMMLMANGYGGYAEFKVGIDGTYIDSNTKKCMLTNNFYGMLLVRLLILQYK